MIRGQKVLALVPARAGSKGLPDKNILPLAGKPLIGWAIEQGQASALIDEVVVSTDSQAIADVAQAAGARVPFIRPAELATDTASSIDVILHALDRLGDAGEKFDIVVFLEPTSPLREVTDIDGAIEKLVTTPGAESVVGVAAVEAGHPAFLQREQEGYLVPYSGRPATGVRRQDIEPLFYVEGSVYVSYAASLRAHRSFYHIRTMGWPVARYKALEIDELPDLIACEALLAARQSGRMG